MKKTTVLTLFIACVAAAGMKSQTIYDATSIAQKDLNGTARFVGMGGAMGALGGDISTIGTNPAGIGIYRRNDAMVSFGYSITGSNSTYGGNTFETNKSHWSFDNVGLVISSKIGNVTPLRYVNFGFNYHKTKSFYKNMTMEGFMGVIEMSDGALVPVSQARYMAQQATDLQSAYCNNWGNVKPLDFQSSDIYTNNNYGGWLGALGVQGWLCEETTDEVPVYLPIVPSEAYGYFLSHERGGIDQYDFNVAFNVNDRFYLGLTLGLYDVNYSKYSYYDESYDSDGDNVYGGNSDDGYGLESFNRIHGSGVDMKLGAIVRPFEESSFRIGLAVHTPIFYSLTYTTGALLTSDFMVTDDNGVESMERITIDTYNELGGGDMDRDFNLYTPWLLNASLGYTIGNNLALGAEYEYEDYSSMKFKYPDTGEDMWETSEVKNNLKAVHTLRLGAEYKPITQFSLRAGYNYSTSAYRSDALKYLPSNSINTDTDYANSKSMNTVTIGLGYRWPSFYVDLAYKFQTYKSDFYAFFNELSDDSSTDYLVTDNPSFTLVTLQPTKVKNTRSQVLLTLGMRF